LRRALTYAAIALVLLGLAGFAFYKLSPWPTVWLVRHAFGEDAERRNAALTKHLPQGVSASLDQRYGTAERARLDLYAPVSAAGPLPAIVWVHGGAFVAGDKRDLSAYLTILAARGYLAVAVGYSRAPGAQYPTPVIEANAALAWLRDNADRVNVDPGRIVLAGDSAGAQIAAQLAAAIADPAYAAQVGIDPAIEAEALKGVVLFCGVYSLGAAGPDSPFGDFIETVLWSYFGDRDPSGDPRIAEFAVLDHLTAAFPPAFVSVGNADPLQPQSLALAEHLRGLGVPVDDLFFPAAHEPPLAHEYQFDLDGSAGQEALARLLAFLEGRLP